MRNFVDLHTHSTASDGDCPPAELVRLAERKRLAAMALTDHDTTDGLAEAAEAAAPLALRFVPGLEISAEFPGGTMHVLALGVDPQSRGLRDTLDRLMAARNQRNPRIVARLRDMGVDISMPEVRDLAGGQLVSRVHMAAVLRKKGYARSADDAFARYIGSGAPAYVDKARLPPAVAIERIHAGGGLAFLAHPPQIGYGNIARLARIVRSLLAEGLDGIEAYHPDHTPEQTRHYLDLARRMKLLVAGGSDFHGAAKPDVRLGRPRVPLAAVEQLLAKLGL